MVVPEIVEYSRGLARELHEGQVRKYTGEPYYEHCVAVSDLVIVHTNFEPYAVSAALLHDVVEDTDITGPELLKAFRPYAYAGTQVHSLVMWLTDVSTPEDGNRAQRKNKDRLHTKQAPYEAQVIKCADLLDNTKSITEHAPKFALVYMREKRRLLDSMRKDTKRHVLWRKANRVCNDFFDAKG